MCMAKLFYFNSFNDIFLKKNEALDKKLYALIHDLEYAIVFVICHVPVFS